MYSTVFGTPVTSGWLLRPNAHDRADSMLQVRRAFRLSPFAFHVCGFLLSTPLVDLPRGTRRFENTIVLRCRFSIRPVNPSHKPSAKNSIAFCLASKFRESPYFGVALFLAMRYLIGFGGAGIQRSVSLAISPVLHGYLTRPNKRLFCSVLSDDHLQKK
jgi:hypothetical protein